MSTKTISMCQGKGSLSHNNRKFLAKNINPERVKNNVVFVQEDLSSAYEKCFGEAVEKYNAKQKRNDRKIKDGYFRHLFNKAPSNNVLTGANKQKSFYEDLVQIGTMHDTGIGTIDAEIAAECLKEYMDGFFERNPNFYVFNAVMHLDEATPHLHIDYIPLGHFTSGLDTRNAMAKALKEMGYGDGKNAINRWRMSEWNVLQKICEKHSVKISEPKKSRGFNYTVDEYKEHEDTINAKKSEIEKLDTEIAEKIDKRNKILQYIPDYDKQEKLRWDMHDINEELESLLKNPIKAAANKSRILELNDKLQAIALKAFKLMNKSDKKVYEVMDIYNKVISENEKLWDKNRELSKNNSDYYKEVKQLRENVHDLMELLSMVEKIDKPSVDMAKRFIEREHSQPLAEKTAPKKNRNYGLE